MIGSALIVSASPSGVGCEMESAGVVEQLEIPLCWLQCERVAFFHLGVVFIWFLCLETVIVF